MKRGGGSGMKREGRVNVGYVGKESPSCFKSDAHLPEGVHVKCNVVTSIESQTARSLADSSGAEAANATNKRRGPGPESAEL